MQINLKVVEIKTAGTRPDGLDGYTFHREDISGVVSATMMPDEKQHTQWRLSATIDLTEEQYRNLVPTGLEPPYGT